MLLMYMMILIFILISLILYLINFFVSNINYNNREKNSPFECGFDPLNSSRLPLSIQFFLISIIFLIFDIEIIIFLPLIPSLSLSNFKFMTLTFTTFIMILLLGIFIEWKEGALKWLK